MKSRLNLEVLDRREFVVGATAGAAVLALISGLSTSVQAAGEMPADFDAAMKKIVGDATASEGKVAIDLPEIAENGNTVPFSVAVESPMTEADYVKAVHVLSNGNPQPIIASFKFSPMSGKAAVSGRMRLAKTQDIVSVAELSNGSFVIGKRTVKVTIGGCGG
ncbi:MAG: thiosulfate oxidation carrier protein SoxY [Hyphomicrobiaceae bacterium]|nr:thiosulfate oxidation carrier protein SoxY [Hyphomicrobiaceae bacterium]